MLANSIPCRVCSRLVGVPMQFDQLKRREFITLLGGAAAWSPLASRAQQGERMRRVGVVMGDSQTGPFSRAALTNFPQELHRLGWNDGQNIHIDYRYGGSDPSLIRALVAAVDPAS